MPFRSRIQPSDRDSASRSAVGSVKVSLSVIKELMDSVPVPFVKGTAGAALEVLRIAQTVKGNQDDCRELMQETSDLTEAILRPLRGKREQDIDVELREQIERLGGELQTISKGLEDMANRSMLHRIFDNETVTSKINAYRRTLDNSSDFFKIEGSISQRIKEAERYREQSENHREWTNHVEGMMSRLLIRDSNTLSKEEPVFPLLLNPPAPPIFHGREDYVDRVVGLIVNNKASRVAIVGPGGMGKTSIALTVLHDKRVIDHFPAHRHFIPCDQAPTPELLVSLLSRSLQLQVTKGNQLEQVLILLRSYTQPSLLILDNLETPWDCVASQNEIEENFQQLDAIPTLTIIITMRDRLLPGGIRWTPLDPVDRLSKEAAGKTFMDIYDGVIDDQLDNLLLALDYIPLAIILVATIGRVSRMSPSLLLEGWEKERTTLLTVSNHRLKSVDVSIRLSLESSPVRLNPDAVELLSVAAMLPNGVPRGRLYNLAPAIHAVDAAARVLLRVSLAQLSPNDTLQILSPVRSYILQHYPLAMGSRQHLYKVYFELAREGNCQPGDDKFVRASHNLTEEGSNMEAVITDALQHDCSEAAVWAAYNYSRYLFWNQPRAELLKRSLNSAQELPSKEAWRLCLQLLGNMYRKQNQFELADNTLQKAYTAFVEHGYPVGAAWCLWSRGETYLYRSLHKKAFNFFLDAHDMFNQLGAEVGCAYCKHSMGIIYNRLGRHTEALSNYEMARDALRRFGDFHGSAWTLCGIGEVYSDQMRYTEARELFTEGRRIFIEYGDRLGQNWCLYGLADIHDNPEGTQAMLDQAGAVFKEFGNRGGAAWCLFSSGNLRKSRDDYEGAHSKFEEARRIFADELGDQFGVAWCLREVGDTFRLCGDYQKATCKFREARDAFKQLPNDLLAAECQKFVDEIEAK